MPKIPFTQFVRPSGKATYVSIDRPADVAAKAELIRSSGYEFTCETLRDGTTVFYITDVEKAEDVAIEMCPNGPEVPETVDRLIMDFEPVSPSNPR